MSYTFAPVISCSNACLHAMQTQIFFIVFQSEMQANLWLCLLVGEVSDVYLKSIVLKLAQMMTNDSGVSDTIHVSVLWSFLLINSKDFEAILWHVILDKLFLIWFIASKRCGFQFGLVCWSLKILLTSTFISFPFFFGFFIWIFFVKLFYWATKLMQHQRFHWQVTYQVIRKNAIIY